VLADQYEGRRHGWTTATLASLRYYRRQSGGAFKMLGASGLIGAVGGYLVKLLS
jgi:hypothetical protein